MTPAFSWVAVSELLTVLRSSWGRPMLEVIHHVCVWRMRYPECPVEVVTLRDVLSIRAGMVAFESPLDNTVTHFAESAGAAGIAEMLTTSATLIVCVERIRSKERRTSDAHS